MSTLMRHGFTHAYVRAKMVMLDVYNDVRRARAHEFGVPGWI